MLNLAPGEYQGTICSAVQADGLLIGLTNYVRDQLVTSMHTHENPHLSLGLKGRMVVSRRSHSGLKSNIEQFSYVHAGEVHQTSLVSATGKNINLEFKPVFFDRYELTESHFSKLAETPGASLLMLRLYKELQFQDNAFTDNIHALILSMLQPQFAAAKKAVPAWVQVVRELLCDNWNGEISLQQISSTANVHPITVSKYFTRYFGCSLGEYRRRLKVERALQLMNSSGKSMTEISYLCAFFDQSHFIRAFREATGFSPRKFLE